MNNFQLHLIFEGLDCVGKTSLIKNYIKEANIDFEVTKFSKPESPESAEKSYKEYISFIKENDFTIADRFMYGENVYAPLFRNYKPKYIKKYDFELSKIDNVFGVFVDAPNNWILNHSDGIELNGGEFKKLDKTRNAFIKTIEKSKLDWILINSSKKSSIENALLLKNRIGGLYVF